MPPSVQISAEVFFKRFEIMRSTWKKSFEKDLDGIIIISGKEDARAISIKNTAIQVWLTGFEFVDSIFCFTPKSIQILTSDKKNSHIKHFEQYAQKIPDLFFRVLIKQANNKENFTKVFEQMKADSTSEILQIGMLQKEKQYGQLVNEYQEALKEVAHEPKEVGPFIQECLCIKDSEELSFVKNSGKICTFFEKKLIESVEEIIDDEQKKSHKQISDKIEGILNNEGEMTKLEKKLGIDKQYIDIPFSPIIQSGGEYDLRLQAESNEKILNYDTIICSVGAKYKEYNTSVSRTMFIDPTNDQKSNYIILDELLSLLLVSLKAGVKINSVYQEGVDFLKEKNPELLQSVSSNFGYGIGLEFRESNLMINSKNEKVVEAGMIFNVIIAVNGLKSIKAKSYAIHISDIAIILPETTEVITKISRKYDEVSYSLDDDEQQEDKMPQEQARHTAPVIGGIPGKRTTRAQRQNAAVFKQQEQENNRRINHQKELRQAKQEELEERLSSGQFKRASVQVKQIHLEKLKAYASAKEAPKELRKNKIYVDVKNNCVVLPIMGQHVPFHITVIKNISKHDEGKFTSLRLNFHVPGAQSSLANIQFPEIQPNSIYIRELTFKSSQQANMNDLLKRIKELQKKVKALFSSERDNMQEQENLILIKSKRPMLQDLKIRPNIAGKKTHGNLETHSNGFRYTTHRNERIDIIFSNIKYAFFQPCDGEMIILVHFHLHTPLMIGKKTTYDIQFYTEAGIQTEDLDMRRRAYHDLDEQENEEREREQRRRLNQEFEAFVKFTENIAAGALQFDIPYRELGFYGTPFRSNVFLQPTVHCLINLTETPFFVLPLEEVEVAHFERIQFGLKNFDLCFIYRDYDRAVVRIGAIPTAYLESLKNWLDKMDIIFSESTMNMNWGTVMGTLKADLDNFVQQGGWNFLQDDDDEQDEDHLSGNDSVFEVASEEIQESESEDESEYSEDGQDDDGESDDDDDDEDASLGDELSDEGLSWDELEERAEKEEEERRKMKEQQMKGRDKPRQQRGPLPNRAKPTQNQPFKKRK